MKKYVCPICGTVYGTKMEKTECKSSHSAISKIHSADYIQPHKKPEKYPYRIKVEFEDGNIVQFWR